MVNIIQLSTFFFLIDIMILNLQPVNAQELYPISANQEASIFTLYPYSVYPNNIIDTTIENSGTMEEDTLMTEEKPKLLPDNMSFGERFFWGENGFFRKIGIASPLTPDVRRDELSVRRFMLTTHQIGGFLALASMIGTAWTGQRTIDLPKNRVLRDAHQKFILSTIITYSLTGALAILSPPPYIRRDEGGTTAIHKTLAWVHVAGMILTPILGSMVSIRGIKSGPNIDAAKAHVHQYAGYITTAVFAASMIVITF
ncbi:MAG: hypothetical protein P4L27_01615 [Ignavibacteriaceae bacterium]|nr:hypothetical protein [Ignavibacteriaceae bacterium]